VIFKYFKANLFDNLIMSLETKLNLDTSCLNNLVMELLRCYRPGPSHDN
jgi:hypothetical protein